MKEGEKIEKGEDIIPIINGTQMYQCVNFYNAVSYILEILIVLKHQVEV